MSEEPPLILGDAVAAELGRPPRQRWWRRKKKERPPLAHCENCGAALLGPYCAQCGQAAIDYRRSLASLLVDAADAFFNFDARFFQSFGLLLVKPWRLTNEFIEGKRARHVHPLRVYLVASVIFFLVINLLSRGSHFETKQDDEGLNFAVAPSPAESAGPSDPAPKPVMVFDFSGRPSGETRGLSFSTSPPPVPPLAPSPEEKPTPNPKVIFEEMDKQANLPPAVKWLEGRVKEKIGPTGDRGDLFMKALIQNIGPMVLCCIPLFALVLKILYIFKRRFYIDHLIFALHTHAFLFLSTVFIIGIGSLLRWKASAPFTPLVCTFLGLAVFVELLIAIRRVYRQNWFATLFKFFLGSVIYSILLSMAFFVTAFVTLLLP